MEGTFRCMPRRGTSMNTEHESAWADLPAKVAHPFRVAIIEALLWIAEPLSAIGVVDVLDGYMSMWSAAAHLEALERLGVVEPMPGERAVESGEDRIDLLYRLVGPKAGQK